MSLTENLMLINNATWWNFSIQFRHSQLWIWVQIKEIEKTIKLFDFSWFRLINRRRGSRIDRVINLLTIQYASIWYETRTIAETDDLIILNKTKYNNKYIDDDAYK